MGFWSRAGQGFVQGFSSTFDVGRELRIQRERRRQKAEEEENVAANAALQAYRGGSIGIEDLNKFYPTETTDIFAAERKKNLDDQYDALVNDYTTYTAVDNRGNPIATRPDQRIVSDLKSRATKQLKHLNASLRRAKDQPRAVEPESFTAEPVPEDRFGDTSDEFIKEKYGQTALDQRIKERERAAFQQPTTFSAEEQSIQDKIAYLQAIDQGLSEYNNKIIGRNRSSTELDAALNITPTTPQAFVNFENSTRNAVDYGLISKVTYDSTVAANLESVAKKVYASQGPDAAERFLESYVNKYPNPVESIRSNILSMEMYREGQEDEAILEATIINKINSSTDVNNSDAEYLIRLVTDNESLTQPVKDSLIDEVVFNNQQQYKKLEKEYQALVERYALSILSTDQRAFAAELSEFRRNARRTNPLAQNDLRNIDQTKLEEPTYNPNMNQIRKEAEDQVAALNERFSPIIKRNEYKKTNAFLRSGKVTNGAVDAYVARIINRSVSTDPTSENYFGNVISADTALSISEQQIVKTELEQIDPEVLKPSEEPIRSSFSTVMRFVDPDDTYIRTLSGNDLAFYEDVASYMRTQVNKNKDLSVEELKKQVFNKAKSSGNGGYNLTDEAALSVTNFIANYAFRNPVNDTPLEPLVDVEEIPTTFPLSTPNVPTARESLSASLDSTGNAVATNRATESLFAPKKFGGPQAALEGFQDVGRRIGNMFSREEDDQLIARFLREEYNIDRWSPRTQNAIQQQLGMTYSQLLNAAQKEYARQ